LKDKTTSIAPTLSSHSFTSCQHITDSEREIKAATNAVDGVISRAGCLQSQDIQTAVFTDAGHSLITTACKRRARTVTYGAGTELMQFAEAMT